jgi:C1A family cysteine protease
MNWKPDIPDNRDMLYGEPKGIIKESIDLRFYDSVIENQGSLGSCTGHAITSMLELSYNIKEVTEFRKIAKIKESQFAGHVLPKQLSRLFLYYNEREIEGTVNSDNGAMIRSGIKVCKKIGVCQEVVWPYKIQGYKIRPHNYAYIDAMDYKIKKYKRVESLPQTLSALSNKKPVVFGFSVYESFMTEKVSKTGIMPYPKKTEKLIGGHAVLAVGYNLKKRQILVKNSWGKSWGLGGYFWMPFNVIKNRNMSDDFWVVEV